MQWNGSTLQNGNWLDCMVLVEFFRRAQIVIDTHLQYLEVTDKAYGSCRKTQNELMLTTLVT